jgi:hypothetical protein|tara:strand:- start:6819 stop:6998 length:180 start_codon:yes stop_codon:yes gene_type:complete
MPLLDKFEKQGSTLTPLRGEKPSAPLKGNGIIPVNNTFSQGTYTDYVSDAPKTDDNTGN